VNADLNSTGQALRRLNERIEVFCEHIAQGATDPEDPDRASHLPEVITREVSMLVMDGPDAYLGYLGQLGGDV
jgi:hypothetical protein